MPLIVAAEGCIYRQRAIQRLDQSELPWQIVYTNPDLTGIQYAIQEDLGVTVLAKSTVPTNLKITSTGNFLFSKTRTNFFRTGNKKNQSIKCFRKPIETIVKLFQNSIENDKTADKENNIE